MGSLLALANEFVAKLNNLRRRSGDDPSRLDWLVKDSVEMRRLVGSLYFLEQDFLELKRRYPFVQVPGWFIETLGEYRESFRAQVQKVYGSLVLRTLIEDSVDGVPVEEILNPDRKARCDGGGNSFPDVGDAAESVDFVFRWVMEMHEGSERHAEELRYGLDAWGYFENTIGVDLGGIEERWRKLPRPMIPTSVRSLDDPASRDAMLKRLRDAAMAYVFGLPAAAMAMCRAVAKWCCGNITCRRMDRMPIFTG